MGLMRKVGFSILFLIIIVLLIAVKVVIDVIDDKNDLVELTDIRLSTPPEEIDQKMEICQEKPYFDPLCQSIYLTYKTAKERELNPEDCESIQYKGVPYYLFYYEGKVEEYVTELKTGCEYSTDKVEQFSQILVDVNEKIGEVSENANNILG